MNDLQKAKKKKKKLNVTLERWANGLYSAEICSSFVRLYIITNEIK